MRRERWAEKQTHFALSARDRLTEAASAFDHAELTDETAESEPLQRLTAAEWLIIHLY